MDSFICKIELNKAKGIIITLENPKDNISQSIIMDGNSITLKVKGTNSESIILQKEEEVSIKCKNFKLEAETITCKSHKDTYYESEKGFKVKSNKDIELKTSSNIKQEATSSVHIKSKEVNINASSKLDLKGMDLSAKGTKKSSISGGEVEISGKTKSKIAGGILEVKSKGLLNIKTKGVLNIKSSLLNIQSSLVRFG